MTLSIFPELLFSDCIGRQLLDEYFDLVWKIARQHEPQLIKILTNIQESYSHNVSMYYELHEDRETEYSETYYIKLDTDNNVILCDRYDEYIIRLVWEADMCDIAVLASDFSIELENHIVLPQYKHINDYLEATKYYYTNRHETTEDRNIRENNILLAYSPESETSV